MFARRRARRFARWLSKLEPWPNWDTDPDGLCRGELFAPRVHEGDYVHYDLEFRGPLFLNCTAGGDWIGHPATTFDAAILNERWIKQDLPRMGRRRN